MRWWTTRSTFTTVSSSTKTPNLLHRYEALLAEGVLQRDAAQVHCLQRLQRLLEDLQVYGSKLRSWEAERLEYETKRDHATVQIRQKMKAHQGPLENNKLTSFFSKLFASMTSGGGGTAAAGTSSSLTQYNDDEDEEVNDHSFVKTAAGGYEHRSARQRRHSRIESTVQQRVYEEIGPLPPPPPPPKGVYLYGSVGSGKTMLADMFFSAAAESEVLPLRRRVHSNAALLELHSRMHTLDVSHHQEIAHRDPVKSAKLARMAQKRLLRERLVTPPNEFSKGIAAANSTVMLRAARALLRGEGIPVLLGGGEGGDEDDVEEVCFC